MIHTIIEISNEKVVNAFVAEDEFAAIVLAERNDVEDVTGMHPMPGVGWERIDGEWRLPCAYESWVWNGEAYEAPIPCPGANYIWNEESLEWVPQTV